MECALVPAHREIWAHAARSAHLVAGASQHVASRASYASRRILRTAGRAATAAGLDNSASRGRARCAAEAASWRLNRIRRIVAAAATYAPAPRFAGRESAGRRAVRRLPIAQASSASFQTAAAAQPARAASWATYRWPTALTSLRTPTTVEPAATFVASARSVMMENVSPPVLPDKYVQEVPASRVAQRARFPAQELAGARPSASTSKTIRITAGVAGVRAKAASQESAF